MGFSYVCSMLIPHIGACSTIHKPHKETRISNPLLYISIVLSYATQKVPTLITHLEEWHNTLNIGQPRIL